MEEKARYIEKKEITLFNDLDKAHSKLKEIASWYSLSDYKSSFIDIKNQKLYLEKINNIYHEMKSLLFSTKNFNLFKYYEELITNKKSTLEDMEKFILDIAMQENKFNECEYKYSFYDAIDMCLNDKCFIVGEGFKKGCYAKNVNGVIILMEVNENGIGHNTLCNLMITEGMLKQNFKRLSVANKKSLGLDKK